MRYCPHCASLFRGDYEHCALDGSRLELVGCEDPLLGRHVDRYRIDAYIGQGSTGRVYRALHRTRGERFAVKLLWGDLGADQSVARRFQRAAAASAKVCHRHLVHIEDFGTTLGGLSFLVMELVQGQSLRETLETSGPLPPARVAKIGRQIAEGLAAAHEAGFVHRDIKPANLVVDASGPEPQTKILDFGLVGLTLSEEDARITASGTFVGTPLYMAPEQARSTTGVRAAADIYSLGVVLHEMLAGLPPFKGKTPLEVMIEHTMRPPPPLRPAGGLEHLVHWCLQKDPTARPADARQVVAELTRIEAVLSQPTSDLATRLTDTLELEPYEPQ